ncbi:MAG: hypothetical protein ACRD0H_26115 [Actinomycetes bacterium]
MTDLGRLQHPVEEAVFECGPVALRIEQAVGAPALINVRLVAAERCDVLRADEHADSGGGADGVQHPRGESAIG